MVPISQVSPAARLQPAPVTGLHSGVHASWQQVVWHVLMAAIAVFTAATAHFGSVTAIMPVTHFRQSGTLLQAVSSVQQDDSVHLPQALMLAGGRAVAQLNPPPELELELELLLVVPPELLLVVPPELLLVVPPELELLVVVPPELLLVVVPPELVLELEVDAPPAPPVPVPVHDGGGGGFGVGLKQVPFDGASTGASHAATELMPPDPVAVTTPVLDVCVVVVVDEADDAPPVPEVEALPPQAPGANARATSPPDKKIHG